MRVPDRIIARLTSPAPAALGDIIVQMEVHAGRKNPYHIRFPKTDASGEAVLTREDFVGQFTDHWEMALMDYDGSIDTAGPVVQVSLFDPRWSIENHALALAWPLLKHEQTKWTSRQQEYEDRITCRNPDFSAWPITVNLEQTDVVRLQVVPRRRAG